ncbi:MAG: DHH family phosphoesterase [Oscillospiraceae bacterium]|nr:DHH family phosphoesterase [Oscillospiraceae bacterium]
MKPKYHITLWVLMALMVLGTILPAAVLYWRGDDLGFLYCIPAAILGVIVVSMLLYAQKNQIRYVAALGEETENAQLAALDKLPFGLCILDDTGVLVQMNPYFQDEIMDGADLFGRNLYEIVPFNPSAPEQDICWQQRYYKVSAFPFHDGESPLHVYLWSDVTELETLRQDYENTHPCVMLLVVDNYEDLIQNAKESERLEASFAIERLLEDFISGTNGIIRRLKNDRFIAILEEQHITSLIDGKFKILDDARSISVNDRYNITFSIGVGHGGANLAESESFAIQCLDMALGRGGDQAAVKTENGYRFFGGVSKGVEKKSRAKTRIIAGAIQDLIVDSSQVYLMGHRFGDLDSIGGCCGLAGAIRLMEIPVNVVVDPKKNLSHQLIELVEEEVGSDLFLTPEEALEQITDDTLLIIVDTHNKDILESSDLYLAAKRVCVIDHHRKNVNFVDNAIVFHHEPYASSACEMITELLQYFKLGEPVDSIYADCLLSGLMLDTKNFVMRTGVRTFEAAAYLRKIGADTVRVKNLFSGTIEAYRARTEIVGSAEIHDCYAIAVAPKDAADVRLVAPQAADELLNISKVEAAFVLYEAGDMISISARSYGKINVQVIMEALGGGGHQSMAATQLTGTTIEDAKEQLLRVIAETQN